MKLLAPFSGNGADELVNVLEKRKAELERLVGSVDGFVSYYLIPTDGAGFSVSIYEDEVGIRENLRVARDWIAKNAGSAGGPDPIVPEGTVIMQMH